MADGNLIPLLELGLEVLGNAISNPIFGGNLKKRSLFPNHGKKTPDKEILIIFE